MSTDLIRFRRYALEALNDRLPSSEVSVEEVSANERNGYFYYRIYAVIDGAPCLGTGPSMGKALDDAIAYYEGYREEDELTSYGRRGEARAPGIAGETE